MLAGALPLLVTRPAPLQDWPNHVARIHILRALLNGDAFWAQFYRLSGFLVPNAALDLAILGLSRLGMPVELAAQCFLVATYVVFVAGFCALSGALGAWCPVKTAFAVLLFYGHALFWGLVNYVLGAGMMLGLLALWLAAGGNASRRAAIAGLGAVVLLFTHLVAAVAWIVVLASFDLCRMVTVRARMSARLAGSLSWLSALLTVAVLLRAMPSDAGQNLRLAYAGRGSAGIVAHKVALFCEVLLGGSLAQDAASVASLAVCLVVAARARPQLAAAPALASACLLLVALGAPERIGSGSVLDTRLALLPLLLLAAGVHIAPGRLGVAIASGAVLARTLVLAAYWHMAGSVFREFRQQSAALPRGAVMMAAYATRLPSLSWQAVWSPAITSIATQAVFGDIFVPAIFANPAQQPIALRPAYLPLRQPWNLTDPAHRRDSAARLSSLCLSGRFSGVYLTVLYPGHVLATLEQKALLHAGPDFLILDACRLQRAEMSARADHAPG